MKRISLLFILLFSLVGANGQKIVFMPYWLPQTQFAGYYMAKEHGFYADEGLDVEIKHIATNSTTSVFELLSTGKTQIVSGSLISALRLRSMGLHILNVLQTSQHTSVQCITRVPLDTLREMKGIHELNGKKIGRWKTAFGETFDMLVKRENMKVFYIPYIRDVNIFNYGAVDAILTTSYNETIKILISTGDLKPKCVINVADYGYDYPEDGLYVMESYFNNNRSTVEKFVRATIRGWNYTRTHRSEAVEYCLALKMANKLTCSRYHETMMLDKVLDLQLNSGMDFPDYKPVNIDMFYRLCADMDSIGKLPRKVKYTEFIRDLVPTK